MADEVVGQGDLNVGPIDAGDLTKDKRASNEFLQNWLARLGTGP